jgi:hypothetical protein
MGQPSESNQKKLDKFLLLFNYLALHKLLNNRHCMACKENTFVFHVLICAEKIKVVLLHSAERREGLPLPSVLLETINLCDK